MTRRLPRAGLPSPGFTAGYPRGALPKESLRSILMAIDEAAPITDSASPAPRRRSPWRVVAAVALVIAAFGAGFIAREGIRPPAPTPTPTPGLEVTEPAAAVARTLLPSTVLIRAEGVGSGVIYRADGLILTAAHVLEGRDKVTVRLADGQAIEGKVLGADDARDVGVVKIKRKGLRPARFARGINVRVGQLAVALGSPFGQRETVTVGVVSGIGRTFDTPTGAVDAIQTDAAINPGNSGGPLADRQGRVMGINVATRSNLGLAVPIDVAMETAKYLEKGKKAPAVAFLGVSGTDPTEAVNGALVTEVRPNTAASRAGLKKGDVVTHIDGKALEGMFELASAIRKHKPGDRVTLTVLRDDKSRKIKVELGKFG